MFHYLYWDRLSKYGVLESFVANMYQKNKIDQGSELSVLTQSSSGPETSKQATYNEIVSACKPVIKKEHEVLLCNCPLLFVKKPFKMNAYPSKYDSRMSFSALKARTIATRLLQFKGIEYIDI